MKQFFERFFDGNETDDSAVVTAQWTPRVDIREEASRFVIQADLPGIEPGDIDLQMDKGILSIKGERTLDAAADSEGFSRMERRHGTFHRRFALPDSADADGISAQGRHGVLEIVIPKKADTTPRRIHVGADKAGATQAVPGDASVQ